MVIKYIGRTNTLVGNPLWEILGNLKNFGVGRMVIKSNEQRYPEKSYMRILKVAALPNTSKHFHDPRKVMVLVDRTFRGKKYPEPEQMDDITNKADFVLVAKDQEENYTNDSTIPPQRIMPRTTEFPPLLKEMLIQEAKRNNEEPNLKLKIVYNLDGVKNYRVAEEGESSTFDIGEQLKDPANPKLYANVKQEDTSS